MTAVVRTAARRLLVAALLLPAVAPPTARAQEAPTFLAAVPESPAFTFLGASPELISRPSSVRDLGTSLLSGVGEDGRARNGFALDVTPWFLLPGVVIPLGEYQDKALSRALANLQLSAATIRSSGDSSSTDAALGLRTVFFDGSDPMLDRAFTQGVAAGLRRCLTDVRPDTPDREARIQACSDSIMAEAYSDWEELSADNWNAEHLALGAAAGLRLVESRFDQAEYSGFRLWATGGLPIAGWGQFLGQIAFHDRQGVEDEPDGEEWSYGGRLIVGRSTFNAFAELVGVDRDVDGELESDDDSTVWSAGLEFRLAENLWATTGIGERFDALGDVERAAILLGLRWGLVSEGRMDALR